MSVDDKSPSVSATLVGLFLAACGAVVGLPLLLLAGVVAITAPAAYVFWKTWHWCLLLIFPSLPHLGFVQVFVLTLCWRSMSPTAWYYRKGESPFKGRLFQEWIVTLLVLPAGWLGLMWVAHLALR